MASDVRAETLKVLRKIAKDESVEASLRLKAAELILRATEPRQRSPFAMQQQQVGARFQ